jgi:nicotinate phosphoribosyltransferase
MIIDFGKRAHDHNFESDWIVRSLLDDDFYKFLMARAILESPYRDVPVTFELINRSKRVKLAELIDLAELRRQLDHARELRFKRSELVWLAGNTFYGTRGIFGPAFIEWLSTFQLPDYRMEVADGQIRLTFEGPWAAVSLWEIHALGIVNELKTRAGLAGMSESELDILYARAKVRLWEKIDRLRGVPGLSIADFGTRRRHGFLWQDYAVQVMAAELGPAFIGTSNALIAFRHDLEAIGTNAHELPMVLATLAENERELKAAQYKVLELWQQTYGPVLRIMLPDTFGTTQFLADAPDWVADWTGIRVDSKDPFVAGEEYIDWLKSRGRDPRERRILFSDGLDAGPILALHASFGGRILGERDPASFTTAADFLDPEAWRPEPRTKVGFGWGTLLTNDFRDCHPRGSHALDPISVVCKVTAANGRPAVKLSDNYAKATGPAAEVERYRAVFGTRGIMNVPVVV